MMAARILRYTQCKTNPTASSIPLEIIIRDTSGNIVPKVVFAQGSTESLSTISGTGIWDREWTLTNPITREIRRGSGDTYPLS